MTDSLDPARETLVALREGLGPHARQDGRVQLQLDGAVAQLVLDHGVRRNALTVGMMVELAEHVQALQHLEVALVLLRAEEPRVFCAGGDLSELPHAPPEAAASMCLAMGAVLDALLDLSAVSVCVLDGLAVGGGAELTTACDHRVGTGAARIHFVQSTLGIAPGWGGAGRLVRHLGRRDALKMLTRGTPVPVSHPLFDGELDVGDAEDAVQAALRWAEPILALPTPAVRAVKEQVVAAAPARGGSLADEADAFGSVWGGPAHRAALERLARHRS